MTENSKFIELEELVLKFPVGSKNEQILVLDKISLRIKKGEFISIVGPSGCGKTSLLKMIGGLLKPTSGKIVVSGMPVLQALSKRLFGFVFQNPVLLPWRTLKQNVELPIELLNFHKNTRTVSDVIELVGLKGFENASPYQLSGGMQSRAAIARTLIFEPQILLMDESFGDLDEISRTRMDSELLKLWIKKALTIVFVTHSITEAVSLSDKVLVMTNRPAKIGRTFDVDLKRPRDESIQSSPSFLNLVRSIKKLMLNDKKNVQA